MSQPQIPKKLQDLAARSARGEKVTPQELQAALPGKMPTPGISRARVLPVKYKGGIIKLEWFRKFTFRERIMLLFGANFVVMVGVACEHSAGRWQPMIAGQCSKHTTPDDHMREAIENMIAPENNPVHQMVNENPNPNQK
jgi:hypothetical protein